MIFIPAWVSNALFLSTCYLSGYQHVRLRRPNPIANIQFSMMAFALAMILITAIYAHTSAWLSFVLFLIAIGCLGFMIRQNRMLPPKRFE